MTSLRRRPVTLRGAIVAASVLVVAVAVLSGSALATDGSGTGAATTADAGERVGLDQAVDADRTRLTIALQPDGDAIWTVELRVQLDGEESREAFESLRDDVRSDPGNVTDAYEERMTGAVDAASSATGREMVVENVTVSATVDEFQDDGVLTYEFRWTNFATVEGDRLHAGDAIDGFFLEEGTRLTVRWPESHGASSIRPTPDESTATRATWRGGETEFAAGEPRIVVEPDSDLLVLLAGLGALVVLGGGTWLVHSGRVSLPGGGGAGDGAASPASADAAAAVDSAASAGGAPGDESTAAAAGSDGDGTAIAQDRAGEPAQSGEAVAAADEVAAELLSNEEQVLRLLEASGGRMKQQQVVAELDWTEAKTSQVVTSMHDDEAIEKFRIGRENVLALPEEADL